MVTICVQGRGTWVLNSRGPAAGRCSVQARCRVALHASGSFAPGGGGSVLWLC